MVIQEDLDAVKEKIIIDDSLFDSQDDNPLIVDHQDLEDEDLREKVKEELTSSSPNNRFAKLLNQRNEARRQLEEKENYIQELKSKVDSSDNSQQEQSWKIDLSWLIKDYPDAQNYISDIANMIQQNVGISPQMAYKLVKFDKTFDEQNQNKINANRFDVSGHTPSTLRNQKNFDTMSSKEQFDYLKKQFKSGNLKL